MNSLHLHNYSSLTAEDTNQFLHASILLFDKVFDSGHQFQNYIADNTERFEEHPFNVMNDLFGIIEQLDLTKYQRGFLEYAKVNYGSTLKWYRKNNCKINMSDKQLSWFKRWFIKHDIVPSFFDAYEPQPILPTHVIDFNKIKGESNV